MNTIQILDQVTPHLRPTERNQSHSLILFSSCTIWYNKLGIPLIRFTPFSPWKPWHRFQHLYIWILFLFVTARYVFFQSSNISTLDYSLLIISSRYRLYYRWFVNDFRTIARRKYQTLDFFEISQFDLNTLYCTKALFVLYAGIIPLSLHSVPKVLLINFIYVAVSRYIYIFIYIYTWIAFPFPLPSFHLISFLSCFNDRILSIYLYYIIIIHQLLLCVDVQR